MTQQNQIYKCNICGSLVEVLHSGEGELVCCSQPMELLPEKDQDEGYEKHVPVIQGKQVKIGSVPHPMEENHYIEWIEIFINNLYCRKFLKPGDEPAAEFKCLPKKARAYCNVHGLWKT